jgi:sec-independent protein translocase protein TatA
MQLGFIQGIGPLELVIVLVILLVILGPKRLPGLARSAGEGLRELRASVASKGDGDEPVTGTDAREPARAALGRPGEPAAVAPSPEALPERR